MSILHHILRQAIGVFNKLLWKFDAACDNGIWQCPGKLSLSLFLNVHRWSITVSLCSALGGLIRVMWFLIGPGFRIS